MSTEKNVFQIQKKYHINESMLKKAFEYQNIWQIRFPNKQSR